ncbi:macro domain-containing protein [Mucilaginibacter sp. X4EP1]|uniref:macro domain-containing protein n=1 Tax=Mucilaginibacter sp. X4EP1 TaxID=2723092 RepID=UPI002168DF95|nr:macro domain-containing protein [Mucilaginibacter sp. X4EP1]MCS3812039.1 O-acetyl-ADP-ribose deacetylase (regulator of RNase III) [Mucilaginibacter sp. X4EP1]
MIRYTTGNIMDSSAEALVNTVNTVGVMGKGIALQFKQAFPHNFNVYKQACLNGHLTTGKILAVKDNELLMGERLILNFPTKQHWKMPSKYEYVESGLIALVSYLQDNPVKSIAMPALGCGNGGLEWQKVKLLIEQHLAGLDMALWVYEPLNQ